MVNQARKARIGTSFHDILDSVRFLRFLIDLFVNTFGITPPTPETERRAGRVIAIMLAGVLVMLLVVVWVLRAAFLH